MCDIFSAILTTGCPNFEPDSLPPKFYWAAERTDWSILLRSLGLGARYDAVGSK